MQQKLQMRRDQKQQQRTDDCIFRVSTTQLNQNARRVCLVRLHRFVADPQCVVYNCKAEVGKALLFYHTQARTVECLAAGFAASRAVAAAVVVAFETTVFGLTFVCDVDA